MPLFLPPSLSFSPTLSLLYLFFASLSLRSIHCGMNYLVPVTQLALCCLPGFPSPSRQHRRYMGLLTGMRPGAFSISADQRDSGYLIENLLEAMLVPGTYAGCFLIRDTLQQVRTAVVCFLFLSSVSFFLSFLSFSRLRSLSLNFTQLHSLSLEFTPLRSPSLPIPFSVH